MFDVDPIRSFINRELSSNNYWVALQSLNTLSENLANAEYLSVKSIPVDVQIALRTLIGASKTIYTPSMRHIDRTAGKEKNENLPMLQCDELMSHEISRLERQMPRHKLADPTSVIDESKIEERVRTLVDRSHKYIDNLLVRQNVSLPDAITTYIKRLLHLHLHAVKSGWPQEDSVQVLLETFPTVIPYGTKIKDGEKRAVILCG